MQITTGHKVFCLFAFSAIFIAVSVHSVVEAMPVQRASVLSVRASGPKPELHSAAPSAAKTLAAKTMMIASWYGKKFQGRRTSSGEIFDLHKLTAANKTLPLGSVVKLTYPATGKSIVVRINDRGPWLKGRDLDLSEAAATQLGMHEKGVAAVEMSLYK